MIGGGDVDWDKWQKSQTTDSAQQFGHSSTPMKRQKATLNRSTAEHNLSKSGPSLAPSSSLVIQFFSRLLTCAWILV